MTEKKLQGIKVALVIAPDQFRDEELFVPKAKLEEVGAITVVASTKLGEAKGMLGKTANPETVIENLESSDLDGIVIVGGMGSPEYLWNNSQLHKLIRELHQSNKLVASICLSGAVLAKTGILEGKKATVWESPESVDALKEGKAEFVKEPVVQDGKIITANGPEAAPDFAERLVAELSKVKV